MTIYRGPGGSGDATNDATVTAVAAYAAQAATSATNAANSASTSGTSATNSANSASSAAASASAAATSASQAASSQSAAATSATTAANSATSAGTQATTATTQANNAANSATAAANSASSASTSASNASTSATNAATSATNAANSAASALAIYGNTTAMNNAVTSATNSASAAATSATNAATSASSASDSSTQAGISAGLAGNSAANAATSANRAEAAIGDALAIYGSMDDIETNVALSSEYKNSAELSATSAAISAATATQQATNATAAAAGASAIVTNVSTNRPSVRPTVLADFANAKQIPSSMSFARASTATRCNEFGNLETVASNVARITHDPVTGVCEGYLNEPQRTNLILDSAGYDKQNLFAQSGVFDNAAWTNGNLTITSGQSDPFSGSAAYKIVESVTTNVTHRVYQTLTLTTNVPYVLSVYAKAAERSWLHVTFGSLAGCTSYFNLSNGTVGTAAGTNPATNLSITSVGGGWYRCSMVVSTTTSNTTIYIGIATADNTATYAGTTGSGIYIYGAQLERSYSTTPTPYYATTSAAYQPWTPLQVTITPSSGISPDGGNNAYNIIPTTTAASHNITQIMDVTLGITYTLSFYIKSSGYNYINVLLPTSRFGSGSDRNIQINSATGAIIGGTGSVTNAGNGWYRVTLTSTCISSGAASIQFYFGNDGSTTVAGDGSSGHYLWGVQFEIGSNISTYIPTTTAQVTRAADVLSLADSGWLNQTEGTFYVDRKLRATNDNQTLFSLDNGTSDVKVRTVAGTNSVNLLTYTEQFDAWTKGNVTISPKFALSPDGVTYADKVIPNTVSGTHSIGETLTYTSGVTYTVSAYVKGDGYNQFRITLPIAAFTGTTSSVYFDLSAGTIGTNANGSGTITSIGTGWYRVTWTSTASATASGQASLYVYETVGSTFAGDGVKGVLIWHPQIEASSSASTYEPNPKYLTSYEIGSDGLIQTSYYASVDVPNLYNRMTFAYKANDATFYQNGTSVGTDTTVTLPTAMNRLVIGGSAINSGREINGTIKKIAYYPHRLVDIEQVGATQQ